MKPEGNRKLDKLIALALGFEVRKGTLYSGTGTMLGGDILVHIGSKEETPEVVADTWNAYTPHFSSSMDDAMWLLQHLSYHVATNGIV